MSIDQHQAIEIRWIWYENQGYIFSVARKYLKEKKRNEEISCWTSHEYAEMHVTILFTSETVIKINLKAYQKQQPFSIMRESTKSTHFFSRQCLHFLITVWTERFQNTMLRPAILLKNKIILQKRWDTCWSQSRTIQVHLKSSKLQID